MKKIEREKDRGGERKKIEREKRGKRDKEREKKRESGEISYATDKQRSSGIEEEKIEVGREKDPERRDELR